MTRLEIIEAAATTAPEPKGVKIDWDLFFILFPDINLG